MNLRRIDLNLLVIFNTLMTERSAKHAAEKVGITASAMSHALRRLRHTFNDDLLIRTPQGFQPTLRGQELAQSVRSALEQLDRAINQELNFDANTSERTFKIHTSLYLVRCLLPRICARLRVEAPKISLIAEPVALKSNGIAEAGGIQLRVCADRWGVEYSHTRLFRDRFVVAMQRNHAAAGMEMTLERFVALPHLAVSAVEDGLLGGLLEKRGLSRWVAATIPSLSGALAVIEHSDLCAILPQPWVRLYSQPGAVTCASVPLPELEFSIDMIWKKDDDNDEGHRWLRRLIQQEFALLYLNTAGTIDWNGPFPPHRMEEGYPTSES